MEKTQEIEAVPFLQPICDSINEEVKGYEILMRAREKKTDYYYAPYEIFKEKTEYYQDIVIDLHNKIIKDILYVSYKKGNNFFFSFNISLEMDWQNEKIRKNLINLIQNYSYLLSNLIIEIVEDSCKPLGSYNFLDDTLEIDFIEEINYYKRKYGFKIAIDDFGTGYSNLKRCILLDADIIKVDGFLVKNHNLKNISKILLKIRKMFSDKKIVFEFISSETQKQKLSEYCDYMQGFLFSPPRHYKDFYLFA